MDISLFLAKLLGLYFLIVAVVCLFRKRQVEKTGKQLVASEGMLAVSAEFSIIFGLVIVIDHTIWELSWRGLITLLGYLIVVRGIIRFAFPNYLKKLYSKMNQTTYRIMVIIIAALGLYLTYCGFSYSY